MITYDELLTQLQASGRTLDLGQQSALYLLGSIMPSPLIDVAISLDPNRELVDWTRLSASLAFSVGEDVIIAAARSLYSGASPARTGTLGDITTMLDETRLQRVLDAIRIRAGFAPAPLLTS